MGCPPSVDLLLSIAWWVALAWSARGLARQSELSESQIKVRGAAMFAALG